MDRGGVPEVNARKQVHFLGYSELREDFFNIEADLGGYGTHDVQESGFKIWYRKNKQVSRSKECAVDKMYSKRLR